MTLPGFLHAMFLHKMDWSTQFITALATVLHCVAQDFLVFLPTFLFFILWNPLPGQSSLH